MRFTSLRESTELNERAPPGLRSAQAKAEVLLGLLLDVKLDLFVQRSFGRAGRDDGAQTGGESLDGTHGCSSHGGSARDGRTTETIGSLGGLQDELDSLDIPTPACGLGADSAPTRGGQPVVLGAPVVLRRAPFTLDPPLLLEPLEGGIERALIGIEHAPRQLLDALPDSPAVHGLEGQGLEDEEVEGTAED